LKIPLHSLGGYELSYDRVLRQNLGALKLKNWSRLDDLEAAGDRLNRVLQDSGDLHRGLI